MFFPMIMKEVQHYEFMQNSTLSRNLLVFGSLYISLESCEEFYSATFQIIKVFSGCG